MVLVWGRRTGLTRWLMSCMVGCLVRVRETRLWGLPGAGGTCCIGMEVS